MSLLTKAFVGMDIVDGAGKMKDTYKSSTNNKYDNIMGTKPIKASSIGGNVNALNGRNTQVKRMSLASDELDGMFKQAAEPLRLGYGSNINTRSRKDNFKNSKLYGAMNKVSNAYKDNEKKTVDHFNKFNTTRLRADRVVKKSIKSGQVIQGVKGGTRVLTPGMKHLGKGMLRSTPALAGTAAVGYGTYKTMKRFEDKKKPVERNELFPKAMGVAVGGAMALNGIASRNPYRTYNLIGKSLSKSVRKVPANVIKKTGPVGEFGVEVAKNVKKRTGNILDKLKQSETKGTKKHFKNAVSTEVPNFRKNKGRGAHTKTGMNKKASEELDFFFEKSATKLDGTFAKDVLKNNIARPGVESIPYFGASALVSKALGIDFRKAKKIDKNNNGNNDIKTVIVDMPLEKKAAVNLTSRGEQLIRKGAEGVGRTVIPGTVSMLIGKNLMDNMNNIKKNQPASEIQDAINQPIPEGKARVIYQVNDKKASSELNSMIKLSNEGNEEPQRVSQILENINEELQAERGNNSKSVNRNVRLAQGVKKKQRMNA